MKPEKSSIDTLFESVPAEILKPILIKIRIEVAASEDRLSRLAQDISVQHTLGMMPPEEQEEESVKHELIRFNRSLGDSYWCRMFCFSCPKSAREAAERMRAKHVMLNTLLERFTAL